MTLAPDATAISPAEQSSPADQQFPWDAPQLRRAVKAAGVALWSWNVDTDELDLDEKAIKLWGLSPGQAVTFEDLSAHVHPSDRDRVRVAFEATRAIMASTRSISASWSARRSVVTLKVRADALTD